MADLVDVNGGGRAFYHCSRSVYGIGEAAVAVIAGRRGGGAAVVHAGCQEQDRSSQGR